MEQAVRRAGRKVRCVACGRRAYEGGGLGIHGHGLVERQQRGPPTPDGAPVCRGVLCRRYRSPGEHVHPARFPPVGTFRLGGTLRRNAA